MKRNDAAQSRKDFRVEKVQGRWKFRAGFGVLPDMHTHLPTRIAVVQETNDMRADRTVKGRSIRPEQRRPQHDRELASLKAVGDENALALLPPDQPAGLELFVGTLKGYLADGQFATEFGHRGKRHAGRKVTDAGLQLIASRADTER